MNIYVGGGRGLKGVQSYLTFSTINGSPLFDSNFRHAIFKPFSPRNGPPRNLVIISTGAFLLFNLYYNVGANLFKIRTKTYVKMKFCRGTRFIGNADVCGTETKRGEVIVPLVINFRGGLKYDNYCQNAYVTLVLSGLVESFLSYILP